MQLTLGRRVGRAPFAAAVIVPFILQSAEPPARAATHADPDAMPLVSTAWLAQHLTDPHTVVLHVNDERSEYDGGHIPGARFVAWDALVVDHTNGRMVEVPPIAQLQGALRAAGVSNDSHVVIVADHPMTAARSFMTLEAAGLAGRVSVLDGGIPAWKRDGHPTTKSPSNVAPSTITLTASPDVIVEVPWLSAHLHDASVAVVDARAAGYYTGAEGTSEYAARAGHIVGAHNVPYTTLLESDGHFKSPSALGQIFKSAGVPQGDRVVTYCHIGLQASVAYLAARAAGYRASIYDGSFEEWGRRAELPVEVTPQP